MLENFSSICNLYQKVVVSKDKKSCVKHIANNPKQNKVRQYKIDGEVIQQETACDFLVLNDDTLSAYLIELKGKNVEKAIQQLDRTESKLKTDLKKFSIYKRVICSKSSPHKLYSRAMKQKLRSDKNLKIKCVELTEDIS